MNYLIKREQNKLACFDERENGGMKFNLKTNIVLEKEFSIEAETLKEAMDLVQEQIYKSTDLNSLEITHVGFDMTDPTIREYKQKMAREAVIHND